MFAYCNNNPISFADPTGDIFIEITVTTAGAVIGIAICGIAIIYCGAKLLETVLEWIYSKWRYAFVDIIYEEGPKQAQIQLAEHTKNQTESNRNKHENGNARRQRDQGGEKKKQKGGWTLNPNKRGNKNNDKISFTAG